MTTHQRITPELRSHCARLATERTLPATWAMAAEMRRQVLQRLRRGEDAASLVAELQGAIAVADAGAGPLTAP
jgi:hypothetical protein